MRFTTVLLSIIASSTLVAAVPVPNPGFVSDAVGTVCSIFADDCSKVGSGIVKGVGEAGSRKMDSVHSDGGVSIGFGQGGFTPGSFKKE
ncbi:hypothetical protein TWF481_002252 [Arthrobotrys musiformis]|uniref:Uncharacterized protein n=1 Tax=Arthrobotrys musiformis TaxID=47236 RepID=A0AAV9VTR4_9PEZI